MKRHKWEIEPRLGGYRVTDKDRNTVALHTDMEIIRIIKEAPEMARILEAMIPRFKRCAVDELGKMNVADKMLLGKAIAAVKRARGVE